jgi:hypothetical protein
MGRDADWPPTLSPAHGRRGSVVRLLLSADRIDEATGLAVEGPGVTVRRSAGAGRGQLEALLSIASDAPPGWRDIELVLHGQPRRFPRAFEILDQVAYGGYGGGARGIGSHLI